MKRFAGFLLVVLVCLGVSYLMLKDSGYVFIQWEKISYESSLWAFVLLIALAVLGIAALRCILTLVLNMAGFVYPVTRNARLKRARRFRAAGLRYLVNGQWGRAQSCLSVAADAGESPLLNYLIASRVAQEAGNFPKAKEFLVKAEQSASGGDLAVGIAQSQLLLVQHKSEQALALLKTLHHRAPKHSYILKLLHGVYLQLSDWQALAHLLPKLKRYKVVTEVTFQQLQSRVYGAMFEQTYQQGRHLSDTSKRWQAAKSVWMGLATSQKNQHDIIQAYATCLQKLGAEDEAEAVLRHALGKQYDVQWITLYGLLTSQNVGRQLLLLEDILRKRPNDADLLLALGRLSQRNELWGKAQEYFLASIAQSPCIEAYHELGRLLAQLGEYERSTEYFCCGLRHLPPQNQTMSEIPEQQADAPL